MNPHLSQPIRANGNPQTAKTAVIMLHGRGSTADDILSLSDYFNSPNTYFLAPQAADNQWYPNRFDQPLTDNQPHLNWALERLDQFLKHTLDTIPIANTYLLGFSQGACLAMEYAARHPQKYAGIIALSGGLIGLDSDVSSHTGDLHHTPIYLSCSQQDPHIPFDRVKLTQTVFQKLNADITTNFYPGTSHTVTKEDLAFLQNLH